MLFHGVAVIQRVLLHPRLTGYPGSIWTRASSFHVESHSFSFLDRRGGDSFGEFVQTDRLGTPGKVNK